MLELVDTHCHIHSIGRHGDASDFTATKWRESGVVDIDEVIDAAQEAGVSRLICVGTDLEDSVSAISFASSHDGCWASVGVHPHEADAFLSISTNKTKYESLLANKTSKVVAIGECGLDYYREHSSKSKQIEILEFQLDLARTNDLPVIFHVREAYDTFWPIFDNFSVGDNKIRGVLHSFSADTTTLNKALDRGLYVGLNGIITFTNQEQQLLAAKQVPLGSLLLETDAPYLTPVPYRGKICQPEHVRATAQFLAELRSESIEDLASSSTDNARKLFGI